MLINSLGARGERKRVTEAEDHVKESKWTKPSIKKHTHKEAPLILSRDGKMHASPDLRNPIVKIKPLSGNFIDAVPKALVAASSPTKETDTDDETPLSVRKKNLTSSDVNQLHTAGCHIKTEPEADDGPMSDPYNVEKYDQYVEETPH